MNLRHCCFTSSKACWAFSWARLNKSTSFSVTPGGSARAAVARLASEESKIKLESSFKAHLRRLKGKLACS